MTRQLFLLSLAAASLSAGPASAQTFTQRGFVEAEGTFFPQETPRDTERLIGDVLIREEGFAKPAPWIQFAVGLDARANTHDQVERSWRIDMRDRRPLRPALSVRRLSATLARGPMTVDVGKQFVRWGKADIVTPTDRFAPRDFLNVVDGEFLPVVGVRAALQLGSDTVEGVWLPALTPSRTPLLDQRWTVIPPAAVQVTLVDTSVPPPKGPQAGVRWSHAGAGYEYALSYFHGFNHLPNIDSQPGPRPGEVQIAKTYPDLRSYGIEAAVPTRWFTVKGETAYFSSPSPDTDEYLLYVVQVERQTGEWLILGGYAGEATTRRRARLAFAPDRGLTRSLVARASYTIDANRSLALETAVRQNGHGAYAKGEYSRASGSHWRTTAAAVLVRGRSDDFIGQYNRNSYLTLSLRYSF